MMQERRWRRGPDGQIERVPPTQPKPSGPGGAPAVRKHANLGLAVRLGVRDTYDYLGPVLLISMAGVFLTALGVLGGRGLGEVLFAALPGQVPAFLSLFFGLLGLVFLGGPFAGGCFRFARNAAARREPEVFDLAWGFRAAFGRCAALAAALAAGVLILGGDSYFFMSLKHPAAAVAGAVFGYVLFFWSLMGLYAWPLLVGQPEDARPEGTLRVLKKAALLVLDNFGFTLGLAVVLLILVGVLWASVIGGFLLAGGLAVMLMTQAARELLRKYDVLPPDPTLDPVAEEAER